MPGSGVKLPSFLHHGSVYKTGDCVLVNPDGAALPFIGKVKEILQVSEAYDDIQVTVHWFYRPEEAQGGRKPFHGEKEVFTSTHKDTVHKNTIMGRCRVHSLKQYEALEFVTDQDFYSRFKYKPVQKEFEPDEVPVYCTCGQPYNPDRSMVFCDTCNDWFHLDCMGIDASTLDRSKIYICPSCAAKAPKRPRVSEAHIPTSAPGHLTAGGDDDILGQSPPSLSGSLDFFATDSDLQQLASGGEGAAGGVHHTAQCSTLQGGSGLSGGGVHTVQGTTMPGGCLMPAYPQGARTSNSNGMGQHSSARPAASTLTQVVQQQQQQHQYTLQPAQQQQHQQQHHHYTLQPAQQQGAQHSWVKSDIQQQSTYEAAPGQQQAVYSRATFQQPQQPMPHVKYEQQQRQAQQQQQQHIHQQLQQPVQPAYIVQNPSTSLQQPGLQQFAASTSQGPSYPPVGTLIAIHNVQPIASQQQLPPPQQLVQSIPQSTYVVTSLGSGHTGSAYAMPSHAQLQVIKSTGTFRAAASVPLGTF